MKQEFEIHLNQKYIIVLSNYIKKITFVAIEISRLLIKKFPSFVGIEKWQEYLPEFKVQEHHI